MDAKVNAKTQIVFPAQLASEFAKSACLTTKKLFSLFFNVVKKPQILR